MNPVVAGGADSQLNWQSAAVAAFAFANEIEAAFLAVAAAAFAFDRGANVHWCASLHLRSAAAAARPLIRLRLSQRSNSCRVIWDISLALRATRARRALYCLSVSMFVLFFLC